MLTGRIAIGKSKQNNKRIQIIYKKNNTFTNILNEHNTTQKVQNRITYDYAESPSSARRNSFSHFCNEVFTLAPFFLSSGFVNLPIRPKNRGKCWATKVCFVCSNIKQKHWRPALVSTKACDLRRRGRDALDVLVRDFLFFYMFRVLRCRRFRSANRLPLAVRFHL